MNYTLHKWTRIIFCLLFVMMIIVSQTFPLDFSGRLLNVFANERDKRNKDTSSQMLFHGDLNHKKIALTFDDGPDRQYTVQVLDVLKRYQVPATFFIVGRLAAKNPDVLKRIVAEGHVIGNHSFDHVDFTKIKAHHIQDQLARTNQMVKRTVGKSPVLFRPPFGAINQKVEKLVSKKGYHIVYWNIDTKDWRGRSAKRIFKEIKQQNLSGSIILFHSAGGHEHLNGMLVALPKIIRYLKQRGYKIVTIDRLFDIPAYRGKERTIPSLH